jgi:isoleucyl-tRNA synthetase
LLQLSIAITNKDQKSALESFAELIKDEINVKNVVFSTDEADLVTYTAKANFKTLGKRLGKAMKSVAQKVGALSHDQVKSILQGVPMDLDEIILGTEDIIVIREVKEGMVVEASDTMTVALDTKITPELLEEGLARNCINKIQSQRKESGFNVTDHIRLKVNTTSKLLESAIRNNLAYIQSEVLASSVIFEENSVDSDNFVEYNGEIVSFQVGVSK